MKKTGILLLAAVSCSLAFLSCGFNDLQVPKKVKVRTDATYQFSVMNFDSEAEGSKLKLSDYFDLGKTLEEKTGDQSSEDGMKVYKYNDGSQYQQFLIHMPLKEIEFDFSESFKDMEFSKAVKSFEINREIEIPAVGELDKSEPIDLSNIEQTINKGVKVTGETRDTSLELTFIVNPPTFNFTSVKYLSGKLYVNSNYDATLNPSGGDVSGKIKLYKGSELLSSGTFVNNIAELDLEGVSIEQTGLSIEYIGSDTDKGYIISVDPNSKIDTAEGITLASNQFEVQDTVVSFPVNLAENLQAVSITKGKLDINIDTPNTWSNGIIGNYTITVSEAISPSVTINKGDDTTDNLNGKSLTSGNIKASAHVPIILSNATIDFKNPPSVNVTTDIEKISAEVKMEDDFKTTITEESDPEDLKKYVNTITWKEHGAGFIVSATNTLPAGNVIKLKLKSTALGVTEVTKDIACENTEDQVQTIEYLSSDGVVVTDFSVTPKIDVTGEIFLPTGSGAKTLKVTNVTPGQKYKVNLSITPKFVWEKANVKMPDNSSNIKDKMNTSINKRTLFEALGADFAEKMQINSMPVYLFASFPEDIFGGGAFEGIIKAYYADENGTLVAGSQTIPVLGSDGHYETIETKPMTPFVKNEINEITNTYGETNINLNNAINAATETGTMYLDYDFQMAGTNNGTKDVEPEDIEALKAEGKSSIKMDIVILLAMDFKVTDTISIDLMKLMKKQDSDLLGRSEASDMGSIEKYLDVVKSATMEIENLKLPMNGDISLKMDMYKDGSGETKEIANGGSFAMEVNPSQIIKTYPLTPDIQILIGKDGTTSNFGILRTMPVAGKIKLKVKAKGDIPVYPFSEQD